MKCCTLAFLAAIAAVDACGHDNSHIQPFSLASALAKRQSAAFPPELGSEEAVLSGTFDNNTIDTWSYYYTHGYHLAGTNRTMAQWTADRWADSGFNSFLVEYYTYLNYPVSHSLTLTYENGTTYTPSLTEDQLSEDETTTYPNRVPTFHGYSFTGEVEAEYVYVGRGQVVDFERLLALGIDLKGKIALARYGGPFRGLKVKNAQNYGMIGCLIFTDTADDGNITEAKGYAAYPNGPARNPSSTQRGSVQFLSTYPGDPTTPGYPSKRDSPRTGIENVTPRIPSLPLSWRDAQPIIQALDGQGVPGAQVNRTAWVGALNATYSTGPSTSKIHFSNVMRPNTTTIWDTIGIINGTHQDEVIVIGNHRDAWIIGGAADPNSGSAILVETSRAFGALLETGWRPRRTIVLCSWDAEEYGLLGSTEFVEEYIPWLTTTAVSYLNIDVGCAGPVPELAATPDLHDVAIDVMKKVVYPYHGLNNVTMYDVWNQLNRGIVGVLGSGSDYTAFLHNGISSLDVGAGPGPTDPIYHYHSNYDSYHWMTTYGDPEFKIHTAMGQYLSLLIHRLSSDPIIPFNVLTYGSQMTLYLRTLERTISAANTTLDLSALVSAIEYFNSTAQAMTDFISSVDSSTSDATVTLINSKLRDFSRGFTSQGGLPNREFFKHVVFAPGLDTGYAPVTWPGITEAVTAKQFDLAQEWVGKSAAAVRVAAGILQP